MPQWLTGSGALPFRRAEGKSASWYVLKQRRFLVYFGGSLVSNLGTWLQNTAQMLLAYQLTHSAFAVGLITCAQFSGFLVVGPWAGALADRLGGRRVLIGAQFVSAAVAGTLAYMQFNGMLTERPLVIGALAMGLAFTFVLPVQTAMVPRLVPESDTKAAMAMNSVSYNAGRTLAPVLCVVVLASIGAAWAFTLNAISFVVFAATIIAVHPSGSATSQRRAHDWLGLRIAVWQSPPSPSPMIRSWSWGQRSRTAFLPHPASGRRTFSPPSAWGLSLARSCRPNRRPHDGRPSRCSPWPCR